MSASLIRAGPARHNLSAAPVGGVVRPLVIPSGGSGGSGSDSASSSARGGGDTDRAFAALLANASPKPATRTAPPPNNTHAPATAPPHDLPPLDATSSSAAAAAAAMLPTIPSVVASPVPPLGSPSGTLSRKTSLLQSPAGAVAPAPSLSPAPAASAPAALAHSPSGAARRARGGESKEAHSHHPSSQQHAARAAHKRLELEDEVHEQKIALQRKEEYITGLQRNCEALSALCASQWATGDITRAAQRSARVELTTDAAVSFLLSLPGPLFALSPPLPPEHMQQVTLLKADLDRVTLEKHLIESDTARSASNAALASRLTKENDELTQSRRTLAQRFDATQTKLHAFQHQVSELADQKADLTADLAKERAAAHFMRQELEEVRSILNGDGGGGGGARRVDLGHQQHEAEAKLLALKSEHESNKLALAELTAAHKALLTTQTRAANIATRTAQEKAVLESDVARWKKTATTTRREATEAKEIAEAAREQHAKLADTVDRLTREHAALASRVPELEASLRQSERSRAASKREQETLWSAKEDLMLQLDEARARETLLRKQVDVLAQAPTSPPPVQLPPPVEKPESDDEEDPELISARTARDDLATQLADLREQYETSESQLVDARAELADARHELSEAQSELNRFKSDLESARLGAKAGSAGLEQSLANASAALSELRASSAAQKDELASARLRADKGAEQLTSLRDALEAQSVAHSSEVADLRAKSEAYVSERMTAHQRELAALQKSLLESQHRIAELNAMVDAPRPGALSTSDIARLAKREAELQATVAKLVVNEDASEASFTCFSCVGIFTKPVTCIPCGHSYCLACIEKTQMCTVRRDTTRRAARAGRVEERQTCLLTLYLTLLLSFPSRPPHSNAILPRR